MNDLATWKHFDETWLFAGLVAILLSILLKHWKTNTTSSIPRSTKQLILKNQKILLILAFIFLMGSLLIPAAQEYSERNEFSQSHQAGVSNPPHLDNTRNELLSSPPASERMRSDRPTITQPLDYNKSKSSTSLEDSNREIVNNY